MVPFEVTSTDKDQTSQCQRETTCLDIHLVHTAHLTRLIHAEYCEYIKVLLSILRSCNSRCRLSASATSCPGTASPTSRPGAASSWASLPSPSGRRPSW